ncbi:uncharacterized protein N7498_004781 [Penicillium cinerascens]|uniref:DEUBAD domain-containing protein n=1 Tax=Penicillium cinerascens TaxID=70096 RepID=A0A9W9MMI3_9EURO|nr:uncharacterized protein N7498_004781 [Penicillium cinerascens]KAJ5203902.1 hypothetical protein N7498_004781 [Penicillium cinerascens]
MARQKAVACGRKRRGRPPTRSANVAEKPEAMGPAMSPPISDEKASPAKRTPRKAAARGKWSEEKLLTSDKSVLINEDLVKLLSKPEAWNFLEEDEKREILALLPADIHPDADLSQEDPSYRIPPLPQSFIRYSTNWREALRVFQADLENGRYDPEWLRQAENARRERENGDFDSFKEREFEQFWGQKQKMDMAAAAGEHGRIQLRVLVEAGVILPGDVWRFTFVFGKGETRMVIDKEARVHEINGSLLSFVVATGPRTLLTSVHGEVQEGFAQEMRESDQLTDAKEDVKTDIMEVSNGHESAEPAPQQMTTKADENNVTSLQESVTVPDETVQSMTTQDPENNGNGPQDPKSISNERPSTTSVPTEDIEMKENGENRPQMPIATPNDSPRGSKTTVQVLIVSPRHNSRLAGEGAKRTIPLPAPQPPAKRKRGRPRKHPIQPVPEPEPEAKAQPQAELEPKAEPEIESSSQPKPEATEATVFTKLTETEQINTRPYRMEPVEKSIRWENANDTTPNSSNEPNAREEFANKKIEGDQTDLPSSPLSEAPEDLSLESELEPQSQTQSQPNPKPPLHLIPYGPNEVIITGIKTPRNLVSNLLQIDGRPKEGARSANAWKEIRCYRKNQDMGSLFEVRQTWYYKQKQKWNSKDQDLDPEWEG